MTAPERKFTCEQYVPKPVEEVFAFFASEQNLERLTPPWLSFRVLGKSTPKIQAGTLIDYQLNLSGIPLKWKTRIELWEPQSRFVDNQLKGPYAKWHHTHLFKPHKNGTLVSDTVIYQLPLGRLGDFVAGWKVRRQVEEIFAYRRATIEEIFKA
ncbi:SRPBCC family protein [bacterium]|nr:SRPBCC family protein [bacterium]